jgi:hypothetical protein
MVAAEAIYFVGTRQGAKAKAEFLRGIGRLEMKRYGDFPLGGTDASAIALVGCNPVEVPILSAAPLGFP